MAFTTPPTFVASNVLTASQMNILSDDIEYLAGLLSSVNTPFRAVISTSNVAADDQAWYIRHTGRYLHYYVTIAGGQHDDLIIYYNDTNVYQDGGAQTGPFSWQAHVDLNDTGVINPTPTIGQFYRMTWRFDWQDGQEDTVTLIYLLESDSTSL